MITGQITNLDIEENEIEMTTWEIADAKDFTNIIAHSRNDTKNLTSIVFENADVEYGREYYGRAFILIKNRGWNEVNNISVITKEREDNVTIKSHLPTLIGVPALSISYNNQLVTLEDAPVTDLQFTLEPNAPIGLGKIEKCSFFLLSQNGDVVWRKIETENFSYTLSEMILESNKIYTLKGCVHCTTNEVSEMASVTFITSSSSNSSIFIYFTNFFSKTFDVSAPLDFHIPFDYDIDEIAIDIQIVDDNGNISDVLNTTVTKDSPILSVRANTFIRGSNYKIKAWDGKTRTFVYVKVK